MKKHVILILMVALLAITCKRAGQEGKEIGLDSVDLSDTNAVFQDFDTVGAGIPIFYNMYLSVELSTLFETAGTVFSKELLNSPENINAYMTSYKKAMNLGVFAVDLSYARVFEQFEVAGRHFTAMQSLSEQMGIPGSFFEQTAKRFENNLTNKDSLISIANEVYYETETYLKDNERFATASVIILGGWVEAIYIGTHVAIESRNAEVIERLIDQKYSLNNLLMMLSNYRSNEVVKEYIVMLEELHEVFMAIEINVTSNYNAESKSGIAQMDKWIVELETLQKKIGDIRKSIIQ